MLIHDGPLIIQGDRYVLLDDRHPAAQEAREPLSRYAELIKRPGDLHTYRITPLSVWNAAASGMTAESMIAHLAAYSRYDMPAGLADAIAVWVNRYGRITLERTDDDRLELAADDEHLAAELAALPLHKGVGFEVLPDGGRRWRVPESNRGIWKQELVRLGYPVLDLAGYSRGERLQVSLRDRTPDGKPFRLRSYQEQALELFHREGTAHGGSGVIVLPCGSGKTIVGIAALARLGCETLILTSNMTSVRQWRNELLEKTTLTEDEVGIYGGKQREVKPVTIATYQIMTYRRSQDGGFPHIRLFGERDWGLIIYDEVHLLPAPVFRMTADLQAKRRLGLTATVVREDGREEDVFSLIGPKRFDMFWKSLEAQGWIAQVACAEVRVPLEPGAAARYASAEPRAKSRIAAENPAKARVVSDLLRLHRGRPVLIIGQYLNQLKRLAASLGAPLLTGETSLDERERLFESFRRGEIEVLIVSKIANFAVDLPDAAVAIQVSGSYGSRQEEAQRIGRIMRPKPGGNAAWFYTIVSEGTKETAYAQKRQLFLTEQGYGYQVVHWGRDSVSAIGKEAAAE